MAITAFGIDVSHHQSITNAAAIRGNNITFCWHKATEGTTYTDPMFAGRVGLLRGVGITVGAYHFAHGGSAAAQARYFRSRAGSCLGKGSLWPCLDMEASDVRGNANAFINEFYDTLGAGCLVVYGNLDWFEHTLNPVAWGNRNIVGWIARYNGNPGNPGFVYPKMAAHQHSDAGNVPGISSVDRNVIFNGYRLSDLTIGGGTSVGEVEELINSMDRNELRQVVRDGVYDCLNAGWHKSRVNPDVEMSTFDAIFDTNKFAYEAVTGKYSEAADSVLFGVKGVRAAGPLAASVYELQTEVTALQSAVDALTKNGSVTADELRQIVNDAVAQHVEITGTVSIQGKTGDGGGAAA